MRQSLLLVSLGFVALLASCAKPPPAPAPVEESYGRQPARVCTVAPFTPTPGHDTPVSVTVGNDGGYCAIRLAQASGEPYSYGLVPRGARAAHGQPFIHPVDLKTSIDYTPDTGFAGTDSFTVRLMPGPLVLKIAVTVTK